ncbi:MAG: HXXEE domain-containing protein [Longimicrobiales bacterium]
MKRLKVAFLLMACAQAAHSLEEYWGRLWEVFVPAQFLSSFVWPPNPVVGFLIINVSLVALGFWCYFRVVRTDHRSLRAWVWFFVVLQSINGVGHTVWAGMNHGYRPGLITAIPFLVLVPVLVRELSKTRTPPVLAQAG